MNRRTMLSAALFGTAAAASAQNQQREVRILQGPGAGPGDHMMWMGEAGSGGPGFATFVAAGSADGKIVKNAPYSADIVSETTRTLADGTRIINKSTSSTARDKDGRMRQEHSLNNIGPFTSSTSQAERFVTITDPVAKEVYVLNLNDKTARKVKMGEPVVYRNETSSGNSVSTFERHVEVHVDRHGCTVSPQTPHCPGEAGGDAIAVAGMPMVAGAVRAPFRSNNSKAETLEKQTMEGVTVEGTRTTDTIPAGEIGNDRAIISTSERWYSPELQVVILSRTNDPQFGETSYRVNNLKRADPDPSLFKVPADFKVLEGQSEPFMIRKKLKPEGGADRI